MVRLPLVKRQRRDLRLKGRPCLPWVGLLWISLAGGLKAQGLLPPTNDQPQISAPASLQPWGRYVQDFRRDHHFALMLGLGKGQWQLKHFATLTQQGVAQRAAYLKFQYSFHLPIGGGWGYLLGSSLGYYYEAASQESFQPAPSWHLPGFLIGLVFNASPTWRLLICNDTYLERLEGIKAKADGVSYKLDASMLSWADVMLQFDYFITVKLGLRMEVHERRVFYNPPSHAIKEGLLEGASLEKQDRWYGLGMVYHLF